MKPPRTVTDEALDATVQDSLSAAAPLGRGAALGRYLVIDVLGAGGMGVVYAAYDPELDRKVAVKLLRGGDDGTNGRTRLLREAQAMARLADPNVIHVYDVGTIHDQVFVAMELVDGATLRKWAQDRGSDEILQMYHQAGRGLVAAHAAGLVHRDFKPDNVLVGSDGRARVLDFGLARVSDAPPAEEAQRTTSATALTTPLTRTGAFMGTPAYMAPEQLAGEPVDAKCDQFAFCVALYEALYGERPFGGDTLDELVTNIRDGRVRAAVPGRSVSPSLRRTLLRGLSVDRAARHPSMAALLDELRPRQKQRAWLWAGAAVLLLSLTGGSWLWLSRRSCGGAALRLATVWNPSRQQAVHAAFVATGAPFADKAWQAVSQALDEYGRAWVKERTDACEATQVRGDQSVQTLDLRTDCYDRRLRELGAITSAFAAADRETVTRAVEALDRLPRLEECANVAALNAVLSPPKEARARVAALRAEIADTRALLEAGKHGPAQLRAQAAVDAARALGYPPLSASAWLLLGHAQDSLGRYGEAKEALLQAAWAADAGHDDEDKVRAWADLCHLVGFSQVKPEEGHLYAHNAEAALKRLGTSDPLLEGQLRLAEAQTFLTERKLDQALAETQKVLAGLATAHRTESLLYGQALQSQGYIFGELGRHAEGMADYQRALAVYQALLGNEHPQITSLMQYIATYHFHTHDLPRALAMLQEIAARRERQVPVNEVSLAVTLNDIAATLWELGRHDETLPYYRRVVEIRERLLGPENRKLVDPLTGVGDTLLRMGRAAEAREPLERALAIAEKEKVAEDDRAEARFALARVLWRTGGDRVRARKLAVESRAGLVTLGDKQELALLDQWLKRPN